MSTPDSRPAKRQRIYRACDQCRRRKSKCDGEQPVCSICHSANRNCTYQSGGGRRGLQSGYVRSLETLLGMIFQYIPSSEATVQGILRDSKRNNFLTSKTANRSVDVWRKSKLSRDVAQLLSLDSDDPPSDDLDWEPLEVQHQSMNDQPQRIETSVSMHLPKLSLPLKLIDIPLPSNTSNLVDFYFTYTHCWFPILERRELLRVMHTSSSQSASGPSASHLLLLSVISYTCTMKGIYATNIPTASAIQVAIYEQALADWKLLELGHIQATLVLALAYIAMGRIPAAWILAGKAMRMVTTLPLPERKSRYTHTVNGCILLDNLLSTLLGMTPCLSPSEQMKCGPVEEDDLDEWEVWSVSRSSQNTPASPLRALSTFNLIGRVMQHLSHILYESVDSSHAEEILVTLRKDQDMIVQSQPYSRHGSTCPPLLVLHIISASTTLLFIRKFGLDLPAVMGTCARIISNMLNMLDHYVELTKLNHPSPLIYIFALQCEKSLEFATIALENTDVAHLGRRILQYLQPLRELQNAPNTSLHRPSIILPAPHEDTGIVAIQSQSEPLSLQLPDITPPSQLATSETVLGELDGYDDLFAEMVTSFPPTRQEPIFAHNLGFYDGDLDTDFLAQLQNPTG
ncbi:hypothetical protein N7495_000077 [Penicillium taxi]|uniref:uncharacterized protein n=1 Tax=Penicillium taxi TaxID=168475 RepID=UPI00254519EC|nr:uncharacterized protein N7495_000077 [Penicillium taxi]KAJ5907395.1 hypothetical protein N7495_000077 [Penicillium taxi]